MPRLRLTKSVIDAIEPDARDTIYWDPSLPGFGLKVTPRGRKVFLVQYRTRDEGRLRKYTIGPYGTVTPSKAREAAHDVLNARREGGDPAAEKRDTRRKAQSDRIESVLAEFVERHASMRRSGKETVRIINREILPVWSGRSIHKITKADVIGLLDGIADRGAPVMARNVFAVVHKFFNWCVGRALIETSPCTGIQLTKVSTPRDRVLSDDELGKVLMAARDIGYPYGALVEMLALTGLRREEVAQMTWNEVNLERREWTLAGHRTKNGKPHIVHLSSQAGQLLRSVPQIGPFVFTGDGKSHFQGFAKAKKRLDQTSGVSGWVLHDLRRTVVSGMARLGVAPHVADRILNHQSGTISGVAAVYQRHEFFEERRKALELWSGHVTRLMNY